MISPSTLARVYAEVYKAYLAANPHDAFGASNRARDAMMEFANTYKNNESYWNSASR